MVGIKMEGIIVNHQKRRKVKKSPEGFEADHIIPYCISQNDSLKNIQFLKKERHRKKTKIDFKIIKEFRELKWIEKITNYSHELKKSPQFLTLEYEKRFKIYDN